MKQKYIPLQQKLRRVILVTCGMVLLLTSIPLFVYEYNSNRDSARRELMSLAAVIAANSTSSLAFDDPTDAHEVLSSLRAQKNIVAARLFDNQGKLFASFPEKLPRVAAPAAPAEAHFYFNGSFLYGIQPVEQYGKRMGTLYLITDMQAVYQRLGLYLLIAILIIGISVFLAYQFSRALQKSISLPILKLAHTSRLISEEQNYGLRVTNTSNDEVGQLTDAFNHMLEQIEEKNAQITALNQNLEQKVTERTQQLENANSTLALQKEFTEKIIDASIDLIVVIDNQYHLVVMNKQADVIYKRNRTEMVGRHLLDVFPELKDSPVTINLEKAFTGMVVRDDAYHSNITGRYFQNFFIPLRNDKGVIDRVLIVGHDITEIMETNARLRDLNSDLEKSNRDLEQFAYIASHDLQEPLRKIITFADLSEHNLHQPENLKRYLEKISAAALRMSMLIREVLNYSRLSKPEKAFTAIDLNEVVHHIKSDLELLIEEKKAVITTNELPVIHGSPLQISQLFLNLISNALKFSQEAPRIQITAALLQAEALPHKMRTAESTNYIRLDFQDNGIGFDQQYADKVFSIFQRLHTDQEYAGTGIGLALCKKIVENHNGKISVESQLGKGTCFSVYLPLLEKEQKEGVQLAATSNIPG